MDIFFNEKHDYSTNNNKMSLTHDIFLNLYNMFRYFQIDQMYFYFLFLKFHKNGKHITPRIVDRNY